MAFLSHVEQNNFNKTEKDESWMLAMHEELSQVNWNEIWTHVPPPQDHPIIGTKLIFKNKLNEHGSIIKNKKRVVAQVCIEVEGID